MKWNVLLVSWLLCDVWYLWLGGLICGVEPCLSVALCCVECVLFATDCSVMNVTLLCAMICLCCYDICLLLCCAAAVLFAVCCCCRCCFDNWLNCLTTSVLAVSVCLCLAVLTVWRVELAPSVWLWIRAAFCLAAWIDICSWSWLWERCLCVCVCVVCFCGWLFCWVFWLRAMREWWCFVPVDWVCVIGCVNLCCVNCGSDPVVCLWFVWYCAGVIVFEVLRCLYLCCCGSLLPAWMTIGRDFALEIFCLFLMLAFFCVCVCLVCDMFDVCCCMFVLFLFGVAVFSLLICLLLICSSSRVLWIVTAECVCSEILRRAFLNRWSELQPGPPVDSLLLYRVPPCPFPRLEVWNFVCVVPVRWDVCRFFFAMCCDERFAFVLGLFCACSWLLLVFLCCSLVIIRVYYFPWFNPAFFFFRPSCEFPFAVVCDCDIELYPPDMVFFFVCPVLWTERCEAELNSLWNLCCDCCLLVTGVWCLVLLRLPDSVCGLWMNAVLNALLCARSWWPPLMMNCEIVCAMCCACLETVGCVEVKMCWNWLLSETWWLRLMPAVFCDWTEPLSLVTWCCWLNCDEMACESVMNVWMWMCCVPPFVSASVPCVLL